jgi:putative transposase
MRESKYIHKSHNVTVLLYHIVCPAKYRKVVFDNEIDDYVKSVCLEIEKRYEIIFLEVGLDKDHAHFLVQSVPMYSPKKIVQIIKSITARELFAKFPRLKKKLWGGEFWTKGYFASTVGKHGDENMLRNYVKNQGVSDEYKLLHQGQLKLL